MSALQPQHNKLAPEAKLRAFTVIDGECWRFTKRDKKGYGQMWYKGRNVGTHRLAAHFFMGLSLFSSKFVLHKPECKFHDCWRPEHLYIGDQWDNMRDCSIAGRAGRPSGNKRNNSRF
jgi:hypothetical protein